MSERKYHEDDHVEIPEEYLNMSVDELREKKEELLKQRQKERGKRRQCNIYEQITNVPTFCIDDMINAALNESEKKND